MARLTIPDEATSADFTVTTEQSVFPFSFAIFEKSDLKVQVNGLTVAPSAFTFTGTLLDGGGYKGGVVTLNTPAQPGSVRVWRRIKPVRPSNFASQNSVPVRTVDMELNKVVAQQQDVMLALEDVEAGVVDPDLLTAVVDEATLFKADRSGDTFTGPTSFEGEFQFKSLGTEDVPADGLYVGTGGNSLSFNTMFSDPAHVSTNGDDQRASVLITTTTSDDGNSEEQSLCVMTRIVTGYAPEFEPSTAYSAGDNFMVVAANAIYRVIQGGVSGATAPSGVAAGITNGTLIVDWINDAAIGAKCGEYYEISCEAGGGSSWGAARNMEMKAGFAADFAANTELDLTNNTGFDSAFGFKNKYGLWIACQGGNTSTAGLQVSSANTDKNALLWGAYFAGAKLASNCVIGIDASSAIGIGCGVGAGTAVTPTYTTAFIRDRSISPTGLSLAGTYSSAALSLPQGGGSPAAISISGTKTLAAYVDASTAPKAMDIQGTNSVAGVEVSATTPASFSSLGTKTIAGFLDDSTAPFGLNLTGTYSAAQVSGLDFSVLPDGSVVTKALRFVTTPFDAVDDAAAAAGGILVNGVYRTGSVLKVRVS